MKLLTATLLTQGREPWDFTWCTPGELLHVPGRCDRDEGLNTDPAEDCGCGRSFAGLHTGQCTTTAIVADVPLTFEDVVLAARGRYENAGWLQHFTPAEIAAAAEETARDAIEVAAPFDVGTVVGYWRDRVVTR